MKNICFIADAAGRDILHHALAQEMKKTTPIRDTYAAFSKSSISYLRKQGVPKKDIHYVDVHNWEQTTINEEYLTQAEKKYGTPHLWLYWSTMRETKYDNNEQARTQFQHQLQQAEQLIKKIHPDAIVGDAIASMPLALLDAVAHKQKIPFIQVFVSKIPGRCIFRRGIKDEWYRVNQRLEQIRKKPLTKEQRTRGEEFIKQFKKKQLEPFYTTFNKKKTLLSIRTFKLLIKLFTDFYGNEGHNYYRNKSRFIPFIWLWGQVKRRIKRKVLTIRSPWEQPVKGEKFVLFPLHYQPEASTMVYGPYYLNQITLAINLARSIPQDYKLYVKEHNNGFERRPWSFFKEIKKYPNIRYIAPRANIHELITKAKLITVITSTTGWEGLVYEKPVITFGNLFVNSSKNITHEPPPSKYGETIQELLSNWKADHEETLRFINALIDESFEGLARLPAASNNKSLEPENLKKVAKAINKELIKPYF